MPTKPMDQKQRISRAVEINARGCWVWKLSKDHVGYGRLKVSLGSRDRFVFTSAHRYAYQIWNGEIPGGMCVLHRCDNPPCCNPEHLFLGTHSDNMRDMHTKGRGPRGYKRNPEICSANARKRSAKSAIAQGKGEK